MLARLGLYTVILVGPLALVAVHATDIPALVQKAKPAVVEIVTFDQQNDLLKSGTGFFISPDGILLTNYHVISGGRGIIAKTPTGAVYILKSVVSYSEAHDVAELQFLTTDAPYLTLGHSSGAVEGQRVLVIGNPVGLEGRVSEGIISAFRAGRTLIQITAPISPGSSGSPVLHESGQVIGMAILVYREGQNLHFAISSETIRDAITKSAVVTPTPSVSAATPAPIASVIANATPPVTERVARAKWPDVRKLIHPDQFVIVPVVNVNADDTLSLRAPLHTKSNILTTIPPNATDIIP